MRHIIYYKGSVGICPKCGGQIRTCKSNDIILNCIDCNTYYKVINEGYAESALEFEEVKIFNPDNCFQINWEEKENDHT